MGRPYEERAEKLDKRIKKAQHNLLVTSISEIQRLYQLGNPNIREFILEGLENLTIGSKELMLDSKRMEILHPYSKAMQVRLRYGWSIEHLTEHLNLPRTAIQEIKDYELGRKNPKSGKTATAYKKWLKKHEIDLKIIPNLFKSKIQ